MNDYQEFLGKLQKRGSKPHKIGHCLGARDAWKWVRKNKWEPMNGVKCTSAVFSKVVDTVNSILAESLLDGHEIIFPHQMGSLKLLSFPVRLKESGGKITTNYRTDWKRTLECWYEDPEMRRLHKRVRRISKYIHSINYSKEGARYRNRRFYSFRANRSLVRELGRRIEQGKINSLIY